MKNILKKMTYRFIPLTGGWLLAFAFVFAGQGFAQSADQPGASGFLMNRANIATYLPTPQHALEAAYVVHNVIPGGTHYLYLTEKVDPNRTPQGPVQPVQVDTAKKFGDHSLMITKDPTNKKVGIIYGKETGASNTNTVHFKLYQGLITATSVPVINDQLPVPNPNTNLVVKGVAVEHVGNEYHAVVTGIDRPLFQRFRRFAYYFKRPTTTGVWTMVTTPLYMMTNSNDTVGRGVGLFARPSATNQVVVAVPEVVNTPCVGVISNCGRITKIFFNYSTNTIVNTSVLSSTPAANFFVGDVPTTLAYERFFPVSGTIDTAGTTFLNLNPVQFSNNNPFRGIGIYGNLPTQTTFLTLSQALQPNSNALGNDMESVTGGYGLVTVEDAGGSYSTGGRELKYNFSTTGAFNFANAVRIVMLPAGDHFYSPATTKDVRGVSYQAAITRLGVSNTTEGWAFFPVGLNWQGTQLFGTTSTTEADRLKTAIREL